MKKLLVAGLIGILSLTTIGCKSRTNVRDLYVFGEHYGEVDCDTFDVRAIKGSPMAEEMGTGWHTQAFLNKAILENAEAEGSGALAPMQIAIFNGMVSAACTEAI